MMGWIEAREYHAHAQGRKIRGSLAVSRGWWLVAGDWGATKVG